METTSTPSNAGIFAGPQSIMWQINSESIIVLGGPRALLLQLAHPAIAAGVSQHSNWENDRYRRLWRTLWLMNQVIFGREQVAQAAAQVVRDSHRHVQGVAPDYSKGQYHARDPELAWWVLATLIDTSLVAYEYWVQPLTPGQHRQYYRECITLAAIFGIQREQVPADYAAFRAYMAQMVAGDALVYTPRAIEMARELFNLPWPLNRYAWGLTMELVPEAVRAGFGFAWPPEVAQRWARRAALIRRLYRLIPRPLRYSPVALLARLRR